MVITVPRAGNLWVALRSAFDRTGVRYVEPPPTSQRTLSLGARYSPEWMCVPFKIVLGGFIEAIELGADTVVMAEGENLCRLGYFAKLHEQILHEIGYTHVRMIRANWQDEQIIGIAKLVRSIIGPERPWREIAGLIKHALQQIVVMEDLEKRVHKLRPRALDPEAVNRVWNTAGPRVAAAYTAEELREVANALNAELDAIPLKPDFKPLRVAFLGEFMMVLEPSYNMNLEEELGKRGVEIVRHSWIAEWAKIWLFLELIGLGHGDDYKKAARPYLRRDVSGEALQTIGETVLHAQEGFDGIVHIQPFTCMPEIMAQNIMPRVQKDHPIPVLPLLIDEQTGRAGLITRLEAFVDLMQRRRALRGKPSEPPNAVGRLPSHTER